MNRELEYVEELKLRYKEENGTVRRLNIIEKSLKALEIIKKKVVDVVWFTCPKTLEQYNKTHLYELTQEEYDLLKEVLL